MSTDLAVVDRASLDRPVVITPDQVALIKATLAPEATNDELELFFYDCRRRGVHPMDKLIHFTKRQGKYTPVTSIDFFRSRAGATREHMGTDDAVFTGQPGDLDFAATVTVYRQVQMERCAFTATARFTEFAPPAPNNFMWQRMPHNQLAKCAEAQALRKGFPLELEGLHIVEEMAPADGAGPAKTVQRASEKKPMATAAIPAPAPASTGSVQTTGFVKDVRVFGTNKDNYAITLAGDSFEFTTKDAGVALELEKFKGTSHLIRLTYENRDFKGKTYHNIVTFDVVDEPSSPMPTAGDIPF